MKRMAKATALVLTCAMGFSLMTTGNSADAKKVTVKKVAVADSITNDSKTVIVAKGKKVKLTSTVTVTPDKAANKKVSYASKNNKIATVTSKGVVKGVKAGTTKVTVTSKKNKKKKATIKVKVVNGTVSKVTLNKKKASLDVGGKLTLKATVKAGKGADKTVGWNSSKPKVASVSKKGVVKGLKGGKTVITAKAADGSGKKASCTVTVTDSTEIKSVKVVDPQTIAFTLSNAYKVAQTSVAVNEKTYYEGQYRNSLTIESLTSTDNKNYTIQLDKYSHIDELCFVQVSIPTLPGKVKKLDTQYTEPVSSFVSETIWTMKVNEYTNRSVSFGRGIGSDDMNIANLPAGLVAEKKGGTLYVKGIPTTAGVTNATVTGTDEIGNTLTQTVKIVVGSDEQMAGAACTDYEVFGTNVYDRYDATESVKQADGSYKSIFYEGFSKKDSNYYYDGCEVIGGSGQYEYSIAADPSGLIQPEKNSLGEIQYETDENGNKTQTPKMQFSKENGYFYYKVPAAGTYSVTIKVTDKISKKTIDVVVPISVAASINVSGKITDAQGEGMRNVNVYFVNKNKAEVYPRAEDTFTDVSGNYSVNIVPGTYTVVVSYGDETYYDSSDYQSDIGDYNCDAAKASKYMYNQELKAAVTGYNAQLPLYRVHLTGISKTEKTTDPNGNPIEITEKRNYPDGSSKDAIMGLNWSVNKQSAGYKDYLYLKPGQYTLEAKKYKSSEVKGDKRYNLYDVYTAAVNVVNAAVEVPVVKSATPEEKWDPTYAAPAAAPVTN